MIYLETNVYEEAIKRINKVYDNFDDVIVKMSGGKDSTVLFHLTMQVAKERGRLPLKVFWLDQEAEWQHTVDYMDGIMRREDVKPYWFQVPFEFPNNLSNQKESLLIWDESCPEKWIHPRSDIGIYESPIDISKYNQDKAFYVLVNELADYCTESDNCACLGGVRANESLRRRLLFDGGDKFKGESWGQQKRGRTQVLYPLYDWTEDDIWTAIANNHWEYNKVYDLQFQWGCPKRQMRVSALIHETAYNSIRMLQEFEPQTYKRFVARVSGTSTFSHTYTDAGEIVPKELPFAFRDWKEYRDYLLEHIVKPEYQDHFRREWKGQDDEMWYRVHVREVIVNDTCGTINRNEAATRSLKKFMKKAQEGTNVNQ